MVRRLWAVFGSSNFQPPPNPTINWTVTDYLGSPRMIVNSQGEVVSRRDFMPFGEELNPDPIHRKTDLKYNTGDDIRQKFTGYQKDEETQLDFAKARMYENRRGRFTAVDPLLASGKSDNPQTFNRYVYCLNNPLIFTDPTGLQVGKWYSPPNVGQNYMYIRNGDPLPEGYTEVTERNKKGYLIGSFLTDDPILCRKGPFGPYYVVRFNPDGSRNPAPILDVRTGRVTNETLSDFELYGWEIIRSLSVQ